MSNFISIAAFAEKHEVLMENIYSRKCSKNLPDFVFQNTAKYGLRIDESWFVKRYEFKRKAWLQSHDAFYFLTKHLATSEISRYLNMIDPSKSVDSWNNFFYKDLFSPMIENVYNYRIGDGLYKFFRYSRWIIQMVFRVVGVRSEHRDINKLLDAY